MRCIAQPWLHEQTKGTWPGSSGRPRALTRHLGSCEDENVYLLGLVGTAFLWEEKVGTQVLYLGSLRWQGINRVNTQRLLVRSEGSVQAGTRWGFPLVGLVVRREIILVICGKWKFIGQQKS
jgi:hypothetical protein